MSLGGRLILINSCLSSIPTYMMGFYHLTDGHHEEFGTIRGRFFWQREGGVNHLSITWLSGRVFLFQRFWRVGVIKTRRMNDCLLVKWIWKIVQKESLWCDMIYAKYLKGETFFSSNSRGGPEFGRVYIRSSISLSGELFTKWGE
jgi:hypothetical protein